MKTIFTLFCLASTLLLATTEKLEEIKMKKRFGVGLSAAGPLSVLGLEADINLTESISISAGLGTGMDYSTMMIKGKYYLLGDQVSPYFAAGIARWWTDGTNEKNIGPSVLANKFLEQADYSKGFNVWMFYPAVGVQFIHPLGFSIYAEAQYLFKMFNFANGTYAGLGVYWYF